MQDFARRFYSSKQWQQVRKSVLYRDNYVCKICGRPASIVHHINFLNPDNINNPDISLNPDNLVSVCIDCHNRIHNTTDDRRIILYDDDGNPTRFI